MSTPWTLGSTICRLLPAVLQQRRPAAAAEVAGAWPAETPRVVYITAPSKELEPDMQKLWKTNEAFLEGAEVRYYNEEALLSSMKELSELLRQETGVNGVWEAFNNLRPGAYKADLWRYLLLWANGGVYLDCDLELQAQLSLWFVGHESKNLFLVRDALNLQGDKGLAWAYWNAMMASKPRNVMLVRVIKRIVFNIQMHYYGEDQVHHRSLSITGPRALAMALTSHAGAAEGIAHEPRLEVHITPEGYHEPSIIVGETVLVKHNRKHGMGKHYQKVSAHYGDLYNLHLVYCDEGGLACNAHTQKLLALDSTHMLQAMGERKVVRMLSGSKVRRVLGRKFSSIWASKA
mmetsp:Transcript_14451/g.46661  ORF Transcript_14451/g.46661 Transcript_14451/m.46661 type:complete len:347 (-) Transcript_14451:150-1190(-)